MNLKNDHFDVIALIFAHVNPDSKNQFHNLIDKKLKKGSLIIFEAFGKKHSEFQNINQKVGGPKNLNALFYAEEIKSYFKDYEIIELIEKETTLKEGKYHNGKSLVIRFIGKKTN